MTKLYIVEGLSCSGKSMAAKYIADLMDIYCVWRNDRKENWTIRKIKGAQRYY